MEFSCRSLFFVFRIDDDGYGSVVDKFHLHVRPEFPRRDRALQCFGEHDDEAFVERDGDVGSCGLDIARSVSLFGACKECELADYQYIPTIIEYAEVHYAISVVEDAEVADFLDHPFQVSLRILGVYAYKTEDSAVDFAFDLSAYADACMAYALEYSTHFFDLLRMLGDYSKVESVQSYGFYAFASEEIP